MATALQDWQEFSSWLNSARFFGTLAGLRHRNIPCTEDLKESTDLSESNLKQTPFISQEQHLGTNLAKALQDWAEYFSWLNSARFFGTLAGLWHHNIPCTEGLKESTDLSESNLKYHSPINQEQHLGTNLAKALQDWQEYYSWLNSARFFGTLAGLWHRNIPCTEDLKESTDLSESNLKHHFPINQEQHLGTNLAKALQDWQEYSSWLNSARFFGTLAGLWHHNIPCTEDLKESSMKPCLIILCYKKTNKNFYYKTTSSNFKQLNANIA